MVGTALKLKNAPIVEAVVDIECDMPLAPGIQALESAARDAFRSQYPKFTQIFVQEHLIAPNPDAPQMPQVSVMDRGIHGLRFLHDDGKQLVQLRISGFSFNRLAPYSSLDDYIPEIKRTWALFIGVASPLHVRLIRLRYINRILLPVSEIGPSLADYLEICPHLPDEEQLAFVGFFNQHAAVEKKTGHNINIILATQAPENSKLPIILDITVEAIVSLEPGNWLDIQSSIQSLRRLKNDVFRNTLTPTCMNLFQI